MISKALRARPLTIAVDGRALNRAHVRGIGRYLLRVLQSDAAREIRWIVYADRPDLPIWIEKSDRISVRIFECRGDRFHAWEQIALPLRARLASADVLFCPAGQAPMWQPIPTAITLHDVIPWMTEDEGMQAGLYRDRVLPLAFHAAAAMMSPSSNSVRDIVNRWPALDSRISMVANGVDDAFFARPGLLPESLRAVGVRRPYVMYVGGEIARKRFDWAIDVWRDATQGAVPFVACGVNTHAQQGLRDALPPELRAHVHFVGYISDAELAAMYAHAALVLYPTIYEGFGLPAVEAQACGTPVLFSAVGSLSELAGPGACILPVDDKRAWVDACRALIHQRTDTAVRDERARSWAAQFTWASTAAQVVDVLQATARHVVEAPALHESVL
jgi:glycosyltransferase involved in cell wall biosynthesis